MDIKALRNYEHEHLTLKDLHTFKDIQTVTKIYVTFLLHTIM